MSQVKYRQILFFIKILKQFINLKFSQDYFEKIEFKLEDKMNPLWY